MTYPVARIGHGYDAHRFDNGEFVVLCGVQIPYSNGLAGYSDSDCAWHALTDAFLGALALGDIGDYFPSTDEKWKNEPSSTFLNQTNKMIIKHGYKVSNCDITIICQEPKIKPYRMQMRQKTAKVLEIDPKCVSIKATTTDGLGFTGREEGIAVHAIVLLVPSSTTTES